MISRYDEILKFWFEESTPQQWFQKNEDFDKAITSRFQHDYDSAVQGQYDDWRDTAKGCLALIILLDQFPRNMFRDTPKAFASDTKALDIAKHAIAQKFDEGLSVDEKTFMYLPFEHSENIDDQKTSLNLFKPTESDNPIYYDYAKKHYDVIKEFGRFPHRNKILGRVNTPKEEEYLAKPDSGF